ncbi:MAG: hypothetical protein KAG28_00640 [Cocleimonas sp.]|nr:hypothetical protein [Cocleimonas sp.]
MKNTITAQVNFSFKGEEFNPSTVIDMDVFAPHNKNFSGLYAKIALINQVDTYSYAYEAMEASALILHSPTGHAVDFLSEGQFDLVGYTTFLETGAIQSTLETIASDFLGITELNHSDHHAIKAALTKAYQLGSANV